jgi:hypothetical protein
MSALKRSLVLFIFEIVLLAAYTPRSKYSFDDLKYAYQAILYIFFCFYTSIKYYKFMREEERQDDMISKYRKVTATIQ